MPPSDPTVVSVRNVDAGTDRSMLLDAARVAIGRPKVSPDMIQRRVRVGFAKAGRLLILLEEAGVIGPWAVGGSHDVLVSASQRDAVLALLAGEMPDADS